MPQNGASAPRNPLRSGNTFLKWKQHGAGPSCEVGIDEMEIDVDTYRGPKKT